MEQELTLAMFRKRIYKCFDCNPADGLMLITCDAYKPVITTAYHLLQLKT
jgi:predicted transcriptional regulator